MEIFTISVAKEKDDRRRGRGERANERKKRTNETKRAKRNEISLAAKFVRLV